MIKILKFFLRNKPLARFCVRFTLKVHNLSYRYAGELSQYIEARGLHPKLRLMNYHQWFVDKVAKDWVVFDVGCGRGALAYDLANACQKVIAIDLKPENISRAKNKFSKSNIEYMVGDATDGNLKLHADAVVLSNVLEHIEQRIEFLKKMTAIADLVLIRVPVIDRDWITLYKKEMGVEWRLDSTHHIEYTFSQLSDELSAAGLAIDQYERKFGEIYCVASRCPRK